MKNKGIIALLAILVIVLSIFAYLMSSKVETISESDTVDAIEKDLKETDITNLDAELDQIEADIN